MYLGQRVTGHLAGMKDHKNLSDLHLKTWALSYNNELY